MTGAIREFERQNPQHTVNHVIVPWGDMADKVVASLAAGNPPDAFRGWSWMVGEYAPIGGLTALDEYIAGTPNFNPTDFWEPVLAQMQYGGKTYGISHSTSVQLLFYNKGKMREAGLDPENPPTTLGAWEEAGRKLTKTAGETIEQVGFIPLIPLTAPFAWAAVHGAPLWDAENKKVLSDNEQMLGLFQWFKSYSDTYGAEQIQAFRTAYGGNDFGRNTPQGAYYTGLLNIWMNQTWLINDMREYGPDVEYGVTKVPGVGDQGKPGNIVSNMYLVPNNTKNAAAGFAFANFMSSSPWVALNKTLIDSVTPSRRSLATLPEFEQQAPWIKLARDEILPFAAADPTMPAVNFYERQLEEAIDQVMFNGIAPEEALAAATERAQQEVDKKLRSRE